ncbi:DUF1045 domain-containing protein [Rhodobacteraceae bacterium F11138]|nr:DUF1045 domain-containing protein [Rhodobacteraceae bacterium F11138]
MSDLPFKRVAVYHVPRGAMGAFGTRWLGWDIVAGRGCASSDGAARMQDGIVARPRRYGLHATMKPPFRLAQGCDIAGLSRALADLCAETAPVALSGLQLVRMGRFLALRPVGDTRRLNALAARVVADLDEFRAPPDATELDRHRKRRLSATREQNLQRWGYPHVMQEFRFHITLTGSLDAATADRVQADLMAGLADVLDDDFRMASLSLVGEDHSGFFHEIAHHPLRGAR